MRILEILLQIFTKYGDVATDYKLIVGNLSVVKKGVGRKIRNQSIVSLGSRPR